MREMLLRIVAVAIETLVYTTTIKALKHSTLVHRPKMKDVAVEAHEATRLDIRSGGNGILPWMLRTS